MREQLEQRAAEAAARTAQERAETRVGELDDQVAQLTAEVEAAHAAPEQTVRSVSDCRLNWLPGKPSRTSGPRLRSRLNAPMASAKNIEVVRAERDRLHAELNQARADASGDDGQRDELAAAWPSRLPCNR